MIDPQLFWLPVAEALMIGVLVGAQREHSKLSPHLGLREFVLAAAVGSACGLQANPALTAVALASLVVLLVSFKFKYPKEVIGLTTDLSLVAVYCLAHVCTMGDENSRAASIGVAVVLTFLLESKDKLRKFFGETLTRSEFSGSLLFLALVFIIFPILPNGDFGPYDGFNPRNIWTFVILVSFVSFCGYFLEKYLGRSQGLKLTAVLGGLASTTAATLSLSKEVHNQPERMNEYWSAATLANAIQYPRLLAFLSFISPTISADAAITFLAAGGTGILLAFIIPSKPKLKAPDVESEVEMPSFKIRNPLTLGPALECGLILAAIIFVNKFAVTTMGAGSLVWTSFIGGLVDVDAVAVSAADLFRDKQVTPDCAVGSVLLAVFMNAMFKLGIAYTTGSHEFAKRMSVSFLIMISVAGLSLYLF